MYRNWKSRKHCEPEKHWKHLFFILMFFLPKWTVWNSSYKRQTWIKPRFANCHPQNKRLFSLEAPHSDQRSRRDSSSSNTSWAAARPIMKCGSLTLANGIAGGTYPPWNTKQCSMCKKYEADHKLNICFVAIQAWIREVPLTEGRFQKNMWENNMENEEGTCMKAYVNCYLYV